jgi:hypothetical protein
MLMTTSTTPLAVYKGEDKNYTLTIVDENGDRVDITGFAIEFEVKPKAGDPDPASIAKSVGSGIVLKPQTGDTLGQATISLDPADTSGLAALVYKYDVVAVDGGGERHVVIPPSTFDLREVVNVV